MSNAIGDLVEENYKLKEEIERLTEELDKYRYTPKVHFKETMELRKENVRLNNIIKDIKDYINFLVIYNQTINGKFSETQWGEDILGLIGSNK